MLIRVLLAITPLDFAKRIQGLLDRAETDPQPLRHPGKLEDILLSEDFDLLVLSGDFAPQTSQDLISLVTHLPHPPEVLIIHDREDARDRAELLAAGALAVLWMGLSDSALRDALAKLVERVREKLLHRFKAERPEERYSLIDFVSHSPVMKKFLRLTKRVARSETPLLILGETGVGKERLARAIHAESRSSSGPFLAVNCGAIPESLLESELFGHERGAFTDAGRARRGYFELAHRGTIFLDEIGEMPLHFQVKLLRVLEDHRVQRLGGERTVDVDVRVMAATNRDLKAEVESGRFRSDLYFRLAVVTLSLPPLRDRREDIPVLVESYLTHFRNHLGHQVRTVKPEAMDGLMRYTWPGNVRELINMIERAVLLCSATEIRLEDLPPEVSALAHHSTGSATTSPKRETASSGGDSLWSIEELLKKPFAEAKQHLTESFERQYLFELLGSTRGRVGDAAKRARVSERALYDLMQKHKLCKEDFKPPTRRKAPEPSHGSSHTDSVWTCAGEHRRS